MGFRIDKRFGWVFHDHVIDDIEGLRDIIDDLYSRDIVIIEGGRDKDTTDSYVRSGQSFMNDVPFYVPYDFEILGIATTTRDTETWTAEIHDTGVLIPGASSSVVSKKKEFTQLSIEVSGGAELMFYVNGNKINKPRIILFIRKI